METKETLNNYSERVIDVDEALEVMLRGGTIDGAVLNDQDEVERFNAADVGAEISLPTKSGNVTDYHKERSEQWFVPEEYQSIDVLAFLLEKCNTDEQRDRVKTEYTLFDEHNLIILLQFFIYMVAHFREHNIMWGVGRGSSVASYSLYLIGVHRIDSIKYNLDLNEFFK
jgi:DNA polymerase III alpha subunit